MHDIQYNFCHESEAMDTFQYNTSKHLKILKVVELLRTSCKITVSIQNYITNIKLYFYYFDGFHPHKSNDSQL